MICCELCGKGPAIGVNVYRVNELGVIGIWRCYDCLTPEQRTKIDPEVKSIVDAINPEKK